jgi:FKBP-type peptidyl-prolyl cis-trans isomerase
MRFLIVLFSAVLFLASCAKEKAEGGYKYTHHVKKGGKKPQAGEIAYFHVTIRAGEKVLNSSRTEMAGEAAKFKIPEAPKDKEEKKQPNPILSGVKLMGIGDSMTVFMPIDTIAQLKAQFPDVKELSYDIVLVDIKTEEDYNKEMEAQRAVTAQKQEEGAKVSEQIAVQVKNTIAQFKSKKLAAQDLGNGLKFFISEQGTGPKVEAGNTASVQYFGALMNGARFDDSFSRGMQPFNLKVGEGSVIEGWDKGLTAFNQGSKGYLFIPAALGYGKQGAGEAIPPNSDLVFYVEIVNVAK